MLVCLSNFIVMSAVLTKFLKTAGIIIFVVNNLFTFFSLKNINLFYKFDCSICDNIQDLRIYRAVYRQFNAIYGIYLLPPHCDTNNIDNCFR